MRCGGSMNKSDQWDKEEHIHNHYWENLWNEAMSDKPQICIPKTGNILLVHISKRRYLICIGGLIISSVSGIWWNR